MKKMMIVATSAMMFVSVANAAVAEAGGLWAKNRVVAGVIMTSGGDVSARVEFKVKKAKNGVSKVQGAIIPALGKKIKLEKKEITVPDVSSTAPIRLEYKNVPGIGTLLFDWYVNEITSGCGEYYDNGEYSYGCNILPPDYFACTVKDSDYKDDVGISLYDYGESYIREYNSFYRDTPLDTSVPENGTYLFNMWRGAPLEIEGKTVLTDYVPHSWYVQSAEPVCYEECGYWCYNYETEESEYCCDSYCEPGIYTNNYVKLTFDGRNFNVPKAGKVKFDRKSQAVVVSGNPENPSQLKLKFKVKDSSVKGSMVFYVRENDAKIKKYKGRIVGFSSLYTDEAVSGYVMIKGAGNYPFYAPKQEDEDQECVNCSPIVVYE